MTIGEKINQEFIAEDFTGNLGEMRELEQFDSMPSHLKEFINELYDLAVDVIASE